MPGIDKGLVTDLKTLVSEPSNSGKAARLATPAARGALAARRGVGKEATNLLETGGTAGPFTEGKTATPNTVQRTYHPLQVVKSTDQIITFEYEPIKSITFVDGNGDEVVFNYNLNP